MLDCTDMQESKNPMFTPGVLRATRCISYPSLSSFLPPPVDFYMTSKVLFNLKQSGI